MFSQKAFGAFLISSCFIVLKSISRLAKSIFHGIFKTERTFYNEEKTLEIKTRRTTAQFWNIWGSRHPNALNLHIEQAIKAGVEIFAFTEVTDTPFDAIPPIVHTSTRPAEPVSYLDGRGRILATLPKHFKEIYTAPERRPWPCKVNKDVEIPDVGFGSLILYDRNSIKIVASGTTMVLEHNVWELRPRSLQWIVFKKGNTLYLLAHLHGIWIEHNTKGDHASRLEQSVMVTMELHRLAELYGVERVIFGGDLNLDINTKALQMLEAGEAVNPPMRLRNLVREFDIMSTRTPEYRSFFEPNASHFADYVLVSSSVAVHDFSVLNRTVISDHAPLTVTFS